MPPTTKQSEAHLEAEHYESNILLVSVSSPVLGLTQKHALSEGFFGSA